MEKVNLGLPLEYQQLPHYFNASNINDTTEEKNNLIATLLQEQKVKTVLDMTCGTGSQVFYLHNHEYQVTGSDFSPQLLVQARERAAKEQKDITFIDGDMRTVKVGKFDSIITIFNAVGHLTKDDFALTMRNISENLHSNGIYIFDILNLEAMSDEMVSSFAQCITKRIENSNYFATQCSTIDRTTGLLTSYDMIMIQKNAEKPEMFHNTFSLQLYNGQELKEMLNQNGFDVIHQYDMDGSPFVHDKSLHILTVARKR